MGRIILIYGIGFVVVGLFFFLAQKHLHKAEDKRIAKLRREYRKASTKSTQSAMKDKTKFGSKTIRAWKKI